MSKESLENSNDDTAAVSAEQAPEQQPPAKKKRVASHQIIKEDYDVDDVSDNEEKLKQGFKRASDEVISKRKIFKAKRPTTAPETTAPGVANTAVSSTDQETTRSSGNTSSPSPSGGTNPFASTVLTASLKKPEEGGSKKVFGFGSSGFGSVSSGLSAGNGSSGFGGGFAGVGTGGKASGFGSSSSSTKSTSGFVFGKSSSSSAFGNAGASSSPFSSKKTDNGNDSTAKLDSSNTTKLPDKFDLKTGEEDEEVIHSGRCKSWVVDNNSSGTDCDSADSNSDVVEKISSKSHKTNLSVQSSTQFQGAISAGKPKAASLAGDNDEKDQNSTTEGSKSASGKTLENSSSAPKLSSESVQYDLKEIGIGPVKILRSKANPERLRLVQRRESSKNGPATKVIINVTLWKESTCEREAHKYLRLKTLNEGKMIVFVLLFKESNDAGYFHHHLVENIRRARQCFTETAVATTGETSEGISSA